MGIRNILHIDMNAFYCACHAAARPDLYRGKATAVAGSPETRHGILVTASYEARARGVRATMTVREALYACPNLILIPPDFSLYRQYSARVFELVNEYTPLVEICSIDECFADVTGCSQFGSPEEIANTISMRIQMELQLSCSIGISNCKFLAKMASDMKKPNGITKLNPEDVQAKLWPLPVGQMYGVGQSTATRMIHLGITTIGQLAAAPDAQLNRIFGIRGMALKQWANGIDERPVQSIPEAPVSIGHSITLPNDIDNPDDIQSVLLNLADQVGRRVRRRNVVGRTVQVTIRYKTMRTITRSKTLPEATNLTEVLYQTAKDLVYQNITKGIGIRLLGISLQQLVTDSSDDEIHVLPSLQLNLFEEPDLQASQDTVQSQEKLKKLTKVTDQLRDKFGEDSVIRGRMIQPHESNGLRNKKDRGTSLQKWD